MHYDDNGWAAAMVTPWPPRECWSLLSPETSSRLSAARLGDQARRFFATELSLAPNKRYPQDGWPLADYAVVTLKTHVLHSQLALLTLPAARAPLALAAGQRGVRAIGGAGFGVLLERTKRVWQVAAKPLSGDTRGPLLLVAIVASLLLAPVVPPDEETIFGVKGARIRLRRMGLGSQ